jgi:hypothetical protein
MPIKPLDGRIMAKQTLGLVLVLLNAMCVHSPGPPPISPPAQVSRTPVIPRDLSAEEAVALAEAFVRKIGYSDSPPERIEGLSADEWEYANSWRNYLQPRAFGYKHEGKRGPGWTVIFCHTAKFEEREPLGRAVTMNEDGSDIRLEHKNGAFRLENSRCCFKCTALVPYRTI